MFVLELSKPSGICFAAPSEERMVGYMVCSRYDSVWHVMNIAVDATACAAGNRTALCSPGCSTPPIARVSSTRSRRASNAEAIKMYEKFGFRSAGLRPATTTTTRKTR